MKGKRNLLIAIVGIVGLVLVTAGISYAWFSYSGQGETTNTITSGNIAFHYTESSQGLSLTDAMPMTDAQGKGQSTYFDFTIEAKTTNYSAIPYIITAKVDSSSTLPANYIKVYLTDQSNNEIEPVSVLGSLQQFTHDTINITGTEKIIHEGFVQRNNSNYNESFRLRMWIADNINMNSNDDGVGTYNGETFTIKVNVYGNAISQTGNEPIDVTGDSILSILENNNLEEGNYNFKVADQTYPVHLIVKNTDQVITENTTYGDLADCATGTDATEMAKNMVIVKVNGDYTVNSDVTVGPTYHAQYGGPKGFLLYVTGTLTNNGTIDNSHGAYAEGEDVYLFQNADGTYEYVPSAGAGGGSGVRGMWNNGGQNGTAGSDISITPTTLVKRATGGGGSGAKRGYYDAYTSGAGAAGTSYSGGTGGGPADEKQNGNPGSINGGSGGTGKIGSGAADVGTGAGNPNGGTGGLLIIFADTYENNNLVQAIGHVDTTYGGGSGGGSINVFYNNLTSAGNNDISGGSAKSITSEAGGAGGAGTISIGSIATGTYVAN